MAEPTLLGDIIAPAWQTLTAEQRTCWHFWAAAHPQINENAELRTLYGAQAHYQKNSNIAVTETVPLLDDSPPNETPPAQVAILTIAWPLQALLSDLTIARHGLIYLDMDQPLPADTAVIVRQGYKKEISRLTRPARTRHVTVILPLGTGPVSLIVPEGYFASTAGDNKFATIKGQTAQRRPDRPTGRVKIVNVTNGQTVGQILNNPYAGSRKKTNRARATADKPTSGVNHFP
jgi:hypothetical protein